jgi:PAS domain S-box-containing protein
MGRTSDLVDIAVKVRRRRWQSVLAILNERDITRVKYQRDAQVLQTQFREFSRPPDSIVLVTSGRITLVNSEAERLFGYTRGELLGFSWSRSSSRHGSTTTSTHQRKCFTEPQAGDGIRLELSGRRDGTEFQSRSASPLSIEGSTSPWRQSRRVAEEENRGSSKKAIAFQKPRIRVAWRADPPDRRFSDPVQQPVRTSTRKSTHLAVFRRRGL